MDDRTLAIQGFEQALSELDRFNALDQRAMAATASMLGAAADLAERKPEQFFGLEPTERERFLASRLTGLLEDVTRSDQLSTGAPPPAGEAGGPSEPPSSPDDITGSLPALGAVARVALPILIELGIGLLLSGGGGKDSSQPGGGQQVDREVDDGFGFIAEQKQYVIGLTEMVTKKLGRQVGGTTDG